MANQRLLLAVRPVPPEEVIPSLRAFLDTCFPLEKNRVYLDRLAGTMEHPLPPLVAVRRLGAFALLPELLAQAGIGTEDLSLWRDERGRPFCLIDRTPVRFDFNLSHSNKYLAAALLIGDGTVGVDVEDRISAPRAMSLIRRYCTPAELTMLEGLTNDEAAQEFTRMWTVREALGKQEGSGHPLLYDSTRIPEGVSVFSSSLPEGAGWLTVCAPTGVAVESV